MYTARHLRRRLGLQDAAYPGPGRGDTPAQPRAARQAKTLAGNILAGLANRTAAGVAGLTFYGLLWAAAANDQIACHPQVPLYTVTWSFRVLVLAGPAPAYLITRNICHALAGRRRDEELHGRETGRIAMNPQGGYTEIREPAHRSAPPSTEPQRRGDRPQR